MNNRVPYLEAIFDALSLMYKHRKMLLYFSPAPLALSIATLVLSHMFLAEASFFTLAIVSLPADFMKAMLVIVFARYIVFGTLPTSKNPDPEMMRQLSAGVLSYVTVNYLLMGGLATFMWLYSHSGATEMETALNAQQEIDVNPEDMLNGGAMFGMMAMLLLMIWSVRYTWLFIPASVGLSIRAFYSRLSGIIGSLKILMMWFLCYSLMELLRYLIIVICAAVTGTPDIQTFLQEYNVLRDIIYVTLGFIMHIIFAAASVKAVQMMYQGDEK